MPFSRGLLPDPLSHVVEDDLLGLSYTPKAFGAPVLQTTHNRDVDSPPIRDQQRSEFCTRVAGVECIRYARAKQGLPVYPLSPMFIAWDSSMPGQQGRNAGTSISQFDRAARTYGVTSEDQAPWLPSYLDDLKRRPTEDSYRVAERHRVVESLRLPDASPDAILSALIDGWIVQIGRPVDQAYEDVPNGTGIYTPAGAVIGLHSTRIVDVEEVSGMWRFVEVNQWSESWARKGVCYTPIEDARRWADCRVYRKVTQ